MDLTRIKHSINVVYCYYILSQVSSSFIQTSLLHIGTSQTFAEI